MPDLYHAEDKKPSLVMALLKLAVHALKFFLTRAINQKKRANDRLQQWRDKYVAKRNARIASVTLFKSVDELCKKKPNRSRGNPANRPRKG